MTSTLSFASCCYTRRDKKLLFKYGRFLYKAAPIRQQQQQQQQHSSSSKSSSTSSAARGSSVCGRCKPFSPLLSSPLFISFCTELITLLKSISDRNKYQTSDFPVNRLRWIFDALLPCFNCLIFIHSRKCWTFCSLSDILGWKLSPVVFYH